jgi:hypothetical protein
MTMLVNALVGFPDFAEGTMLVLIYVGCGYVGMVWTA